MSALFPFCDAQFTLIAPSSIRGKQYFTRKLTTLPTVTNTIIIDDIDTDNADKRKTKRTHHEWHGIAIVFITRNPTRMFKISHVNSYLQDNKIENYSLLSIKATSLIFIFKEKTPFGKK